MRISNVLLLGILIALLANELNAGPKKDSVNCTVTGISENVIQQLKKRISPF